MLERIKSFSGLVNEMLDQLPKTVWSSETTTFFDPAIGGGQFVHEIERRLRDHGHTDDNIRSRVFGFEYSMALVDLAVNMNKLVGQYSRMPYENFLELDNSMKFDVVVGNPPYQDKKGNEDSTNSADLYARFTLKFIELSKKYVAIVVPSAWTGPKNSSLKKTIFQDNQPMALNTHGTKWFNVKMNTCYFITEVGRKGSTVVSDASGTTINMTLDKSVALSTNLAMMSLKSKMSSFAKNNNFSSKWIRGKLHLNEVNLNLGNSVEFIRAVGRKTSGLELSTIKSGVEYTGYGINKLVIPNMGSSSGIGHIKIAKKNQVGGHSVVFLTANNQSELPNMKSYLESKAIRFLIDAVKISTPNSKKLFSFIPVIDFTRSWTDTEIYKHFNLTQAEIDYIEANVK